MEDRPKMDMHDPINSPAHYTTGKIEVWDFIVDHNLNFLEGNVVKYVCRARHKESLITDLLKARAYLNKLIQVELGKIMAHPDPETGKVEIPLGNTVPFEKPHYIVTDPPTADMDKHHRKMWEHALKKGHKK